MASIDKTYIDSEEYPLYRQWWIDNYDKMMEEMGCAVYLMPFVLFKNEPDDMTPEFLNTYHRDLLEVADKDENDEIVIWNTSERWDLWLVKNCPIESYQERLREVYESDWEGFNC